MTLDEMFIYILREDQEHFHELGDGHVYMSLATMENFLLPTLHIMRFMHEHTEKRLPGGVESMIACSFFNQGSCLPRNRAEYDLEVLRNYVFPQNEIYRSNCKAAQKLMKAYPLIKVRP
jgi:hypothetical protein